MRALPYLNLFAVMQLRYLYCNRRSKSEATFVNENSCVNTAWWTVTGVRHVAYSMGTLVHQICPGGRGELVEGPIPKCTNVIYGR